MKYIITIIALSLPTLLSGQTTKAPVSVKAGSALFVNINGQDYPRAGYLGFNYTYNTHDSQVSIYYISTGQTFLKPTVDTMFTYSDSTGKKARNMNSLRAWLQTNAY